MTFILDPIERVPEKPGLFNNKAEADTYTKESGRGIMAFIQHLFVKDILAKVGHLSHLKVLDLGTGPGWIPCMLGKARPTWDITAVDYAAPILDIARQNAKKAGVKVNWVFAKAENTSMQSKQFDLIISNFAFSEFPHGEAVLREIERLLKPGGMVVLQDLLRPPRWQMPFLMLWRFVTRPFSRIYRHYRQILKGTYTLQEYHTMFRRTSLVYNADVFMRWGGGIGRVWGIKPSRVQPESITEEPVAEVQR